MPSAPLLGTDCIRTGQICDCGNWARVSGWLAGVRGSARGDQPRRRRESKQRDRRSLARISPALAFAPLMPITAAAAIFRVETLAVEFRTKEFSVRGISEAEHHTRSA